MRPLLLFIFCFTCLFHQTLAQELKVSGRIFDQETLEPLAFVNIVTANNQTGTISGIDGRFVLWVNDSSVNLSFSYVGYEPVMIRLSNRAKPGGDLEIFLRRSTFFLDEVEVRAGENPALPIIRAAVANRKQNDPQRLPFYRFKTYNKFYLQPVPSQKTRITTQRDTANAVLMESVTEKKFKQPGLVKETVLANRVSGLQDLKLTTLANSFQPFTFYNEQIEVLGNRFLNPVSKAGLTSYFFSLEDTIYQSGDTTYLVYFEPRQAENQNLMEGVLYINTEQWALQNVIAEAGEGNTRIKFQQQYQQIDQTWFPQQLNTNLYFQLDDTTNLEGIGRSYLFDIDLETPVKSSEIDRMALEFEKEANHRPQNYWQGYRYEPLTERDRRIYEKMDSIGRAQNLDLQIKGISSIISGRIPIGSVDLMLNQLVRYNRLEKLRLGLGLATNEYFSEWMQLEGYAAYGFGDQRWKYGGGISVSPGNFNDLTFFFNYKNDLLESGDIEFYPIEQSILNPENFREFYVSNLDRIERYQGGFQMYLLKFLDLKTSLRSITKTVTNDYQFAPLTTAADTVVQPAYHFAEIGLQMKYAFGEQKMEVMGFEIPTESKFPVLWFNLFRGIDGLFRGEFDYWKLEARLHQDWRIGSSGKSSLRLMGGFIDQVIPAPHLFYGHSNYYNKLSISSPYSFQTMRMNEFLSDRFLNIFWRYDLGPLYNSNLSEPRLVFSASAGWGDLQQPEIHQVEINTMEKGFYEVGIELPYLLKGAFNGIGIGGFYRLGDYSFDDFKDNFAFRLNILFGFN